LTLSVEGGECHGVLVVDVADANGGAAQAAPFPAGSCCGALIRVRRVPVVRVFGWRSCPSASFVVPDSSVWVVGEGQVVDGVP
ncbi:hypothetical protein, partial [Salinispora arenicola]|uniref:hypothetical protein n=1 Tax=Salinispora arenicola TaxID=168697 RepID=UPI0027DB1965